MLGNGEGDERKGEARRVRERDKLKKGGRANCEERGRRI